MNKPQKKLIVPEVDEGTRRINLVNTGYNQAIKDRDQYDALVEAQKPKIIITPVKEVYPKSGKSKYIKDSQ